jgi:hypothetical protein
MADDAPGPLWRVVLNANIILQAPLRDTLLRLAEEDELAVYWSEDILDEVARNFAAVSGRVGVERRLAHLFTALARTFPDSRIDGYEWLLPTLPITAHDRHILACAIVARVDLIITYNLRHFPRRHLDPYAIQAWHPDTLLRDILRRRPDALRHILVAQGRGMRPPRTLAQVLNRLARDAPRFVAEARAAFGL